MHAPQSLPSVAYTVKMKKKKNHNQVKLIRHIRSAGKTLEEYSVAAFQLFRPYVARILLREQKNIKERTGVVYILDEENIISSCTWYA